MNQSDLFSEDELRLILGVLEYHVVQNQLRRDCLSDKDIEFDDMAVEIIAAIRSKLS